MVDTGSELLANVLANPAEDAPRLVYADWLEENGDAARAEFIRVGCELAKNDRLRRQDRSPKGGLYVYSDLERADFLRRRENVLLDAFTGNGTRNWIRWLGVGGLVSAATEPMVFRRGFLAELACGGDDWVRHADGILALHPIERVTLTSMPSLHFEPQNRRFYFVRDVGRHIPELPVAEAGFAGSNLHYGAAVMLLEREWPGIHFTFPTAVAVAIA